LSGVDPAKMGIMRTCRTIFLALLSLLLSGSSAQVGKQPEAPGKLYDLGGYRLHLNVMGKGGPTVVLCAGAGDFSFDWASVQPEVAKYVQVASYDRGGEAWSDLGPKPYTDKQAVFDLHRLLHKAGFKGPFILVGHSMGGSHIWQFAIDYPKEVVGMVLVDASCGKSMMNINGKEGWAASFSKGRVVPAVRSKIGPDDPLTPKDVAAIMTYVEKYPFMQPHIEDPYDKLPAEAQKQRLWALAQPKHWAAGQNDLFGEESEALLKTWEGKTNSLHGIPLFILSREVPATAPKMDQDHKLVEQELARQSTNSRLTFIVGSGHHIHIEKPQAVIDAIKWVFDELKKKR